MPEISYANIALDIEAKELRDKLFAYQIPEHLYETVYIGSQVLVPFGRQTSVGGYVVSISTNRPEDIKRIRPISDVVEAVPLFDREYIEFLHWLARTCCANLSDVIAAALPSFLAPRLKRRVRLSESGKATNQLALSRESQLMLSLIGEKEVSHSSLKQKFLKMSGASQATFYKQLNSLKKDNLIEVNAETAAAVKEKTETRVSLGEEKPKTNRQIEIVTKLKEILSTSQSSSVVLKSLVEKAKTTRATIKKLSDSKMLKLFEARVLRDPLPGMTLDKEQTKKEAIKLTNYQENCLHVLERELDKALEGKQEDPLKPWLLHGVTGSGKTEVYLRLVEKTIEQNKSALLLVPEISLTPQLASLLVSRFGDQVAIWHSAISQGERLDTWKRLKSGHAKVLLGARSAVLANIKDLALIILDEEHDSSYKQTSPSPRYNAKTVALEKARRSGALLVLGSATPDLVTYHEAEKERRILSLPERVHKQEMPKVEIVDMRKELSSGNRSIFSLSLKQQIEDRLEKKEQAILLMNRRGYANHVFCRACGYVARCKNCSVSMVYHRYLDRNIPAYQATYDTTSSASRTGSLKGFLACHHCGINKSMTNRCPECLSPFLKEYGLGTQKVEETIREQFPKARTVRLDSDITTKKGEFKRVLDLFNSGEADILIGTQMVAKGLDVPNVTLVGVLAADASLNMPDYRSTERGFQLLSQVAGRAGRGLRPGQVIFQTYNPELELFEWAKKHDYLSFSEVELASREEFDYPPFSRVLRIVVSSPDVEMVEKECTYIVQELKALLSDDNQAFCQLLGPAPCIIEKIRGSYRYHLLIKILDQDNLMNQIIDYLRKRKNKLKVRTIVDVDALDLL